MLSFSPQVFIKGLVFSTGPLFTGGRVIKNNQGRVEEQGWCGDGKKKRTIYHLLQLCETNKKNTNILKQFS